MNNKKHLRRHTQMHRGNTNRHRVASSLYLPPQNDHPNPNNPDSDDPDREKAVVSFRKHVAQVKSEDLTNKWHPTSATDTTILNQVADKKFLIMELQRSHKNTKELENNLNKAARLGEQLILWNEELEARLERIQSEQNEQNNEHNDEVNDMEDENDSNEAPRKMSLVDADDNTKNKKEDQKRITLFGDIVGEDQNDQEDVVSEKAPRKMSKRMTLFGDVVGEKDQNDQQDEKDKVTFILSENKSLTKRLNGVTKHLYEAECVNEELHHQVQALDTQLLLLKQNQIRKYSRTPSPTTTSFSDDIDQTSELKTLKKEIQKLQLQQISDVNELKQQLSSSENNVTLIKKKYNAFKRKDIENSKEKKYVEFKMQELENNCKTANANCKRWENKAKQFQNDIEELNSIRKSCALSSSTKRRRRRSSFGGRRVEKNELVLEHIIKIDPAESRVARPSDKDPFKIFTEGRNYKKLMI